jgi:hypothetical protein
MSKRKEDRLQVEDLARTKRLAKDRVRPRVTAAHELCAAR